MIFLIDDRKSRQIDFGWTAEKFAQYSNQLTPLYTIEDVVKHGENIYNDDNLILYHESFLDFTNDSRNAVEQRNKLQGMALANSRLSVAFFSGSQNTRTYSLNTASVPVGLLYQNLELLIKKANGTKINLKHLLFGENPEIEQELDEILTDVNRNIENEPAIIAGANLFIRPNTRYIQSAIEGAKEEIIFPDASDEKMSEKVSEWLNKDEYDNIFLPLCFGETLSDYNGLRLATHIRCTPSKNQLKRIFIYGFVGLAYLIEHEYFNILKTKNIQLVSYSKIAFGTAANSNFASFKPEELATEIKKLKLDPPLNYADSHSIANEWAINQWAKTIGCDETEELVKLFINVQFNLYFKYLKTVYPISEQNQISNEQLKIHYKCKPKVLLIDDEAHKGWDEIFANILHDISEVDFECIGYDFKNFSSDEIIQKSIDKIEFDDIDVVVLDFRLCQSDFEIENSKEITSVRLLKQIKKKNPGIQVIVFSATNKVWNLQALQEAEADGFIFKDGGKNCNHAIIKLIEVMSSSVEKASWLKPIWSKTSLVISHLEKRSINHSLDSKFTGAICTFLQLGFDSLIRSNSRFPFDSAFMYYFLILEAVSTQIVAKDNPHKVMCMVKNKKSLIGYKFQFRKNYNFLKAFEENTFLRVAPGDDLISNNKRIPYNEKFHNVIAYAGLQNVDPKSIVKLRNKFNHPDLVSQTKIAIIKKEDVDAIFTVCIELLKKL